MLQALVKNGRVVAADVPVPVVSPGAVLIKTVYSCTSADTELVGLQGSASKSLIRQALQQPEKVAKAWQMFKDKGFARTIDKVRQHSGTSQGIQVSRPIPLMQLVATIDITLAME